MPVLHSTKNLKITTPATETRTGVGIFEYTDAYTVFHYGRMPDLIPGKGEAISRMAAFNFALLEAAGVRTHFRRFIAPHRIEFDLAHLPAPDTLPLPPGARNTLIPVQVLVRTELPQGSSVHRRLATGTLTPAQAGLSSLPAVGEELKKPLVEFATMLDNVNQYIDTAEAQRLTGLDDDQFHDLLDTTATVNRVLTEHARTVGLRHCDGKLEFVVAGDGGLMLADSPGTPDESRLLYDGVHCGKQVLRNWYVDNGHAVPVNQLIAEGVPRHRWPTPTPLPGDFLPVMSDLYQSLSETWTGERRWNAPNLQAATAAVARVLGH
ncbi:phosphoribosylaminoimidazolesuccinocarboxamide synthase [Streptomyces paludis]|uniref:phosphoribosylaminoimidazolesuccinocarboxamide synthase n=1 Tax=Streptomyces paludis TaxID=2282738 RepID=A0A345I1X0_9ACTN|nr:phosphoribosylaminoimidazolesuccinocarboxamide synthase [Streptomyces paludis]AXG82944.1 phosphoribosylaminoimidazolesuccinocarboxamide synthase [Streptomyces paludis]